MAVLFFSISMIAPNVPTNMTVAMHVFSSSRSFHFLDTSYWCLSIVSSLMCYKILVLWIILPDYHGYIGDYIFLRFSVFYTSTEGEVCFLTLHFSFTFCKFYTSHTLAHYKQKYLFGAYSVFWLIKYMISIFDTLLFRID